MTNNTNVLADTDIDIENETIKVIETPVYTFTIKDSTNPEYGVTTQIINWLQENMESLKDDYDKSIFGKVNTGFNDNLLKTFGKKPVCDVYINNIEYDGDFEDHVPRKVNSIILVYMKGANNVTYIKACELHDYLMQKLITDTSFRRLTDVVEDTYITDSEIRVQSIRGGMGVMGVFKLSHTLYY